MAKAPKKTAAKAAVKSVAIPEGGVSATQAGLVEQIAPPAVAPVVEPVATVQGNEKAKATVEPKSAPKKARTLVFPGTFRINNNTRMGLELPIVSAQVAAGGSELIEIRDESQMKALRTDLDALSSLNGFGKDAFVVVAESAGEGVTE